MIQIYVSPRWSNTSLRHTYPTSHTPDRQMVFEPTLQGTSRSQHSWLIGLRLPHRVSSLPARAKMGIVVASRWSVIDRVADLPYHYFPRKVRLLLARLSKRLHVLALSLMTRWPTTHWVNVYVYVMTCSELQSD